MIIHLNPQSLIKPRAPFSHGVMVTGGARWLYISGQVSSASSVEQQIEEIWKNLLAVLAEAEMAVSDLVKITTFLTDQRDVAVYSLARAQYLDSARPASTIVIVSALARPELKVEVEAVAARS